MCDKDILTKDKCDACSDICVGRLIELEVNKRLDEFKGRPIPEVYETLEHEGFFSRIGIDFISLEEKEGGSYTFCWRIKRK